MTGTRRVGAQDVQPVCRHSACTCCGHVVRGENFFLKKTYCALIKPFPSSPPKGFETYINSFRHNMHGSAWVGRHWQQWPGIDSGVLCTSTSTTYHAPPPLLQFFFANIHTAKMSTAMRGSF